MSFRKEESGQIAVLAALSMTIVFGFMALAIDVGILFNAKRKLQNAVDAAVTSAAIDYMFNASTSTATTAANAAITANKISNASVTVNFNPHITSPYHNSVNYVEVLASQPDPTYFMGFFGKRAVTITARAVAGMPGPNSGNACVIVLDPTASQAMYLQGSFNVSADKCGVVVNSSASDALYFQGGGGTLTAGYVSVVGGAGGKTGDSTPAPVEGATPVLNPFPSLTGPSPSDCTSGNTNSLSSYTGGSGIKTSGNLTCFTNTAGVTLNGGTLPSGVLFFQHGVTLNNTIYSGTGGSTLDVYGGSFNVGSKANLSLTAPTSAPITSVPSGIAIMQPASNTNQMQLQFGASCGGVTGVIYAPTATLFLQDSGCDKNGGISITTDLIVDKLNVQTSTLNIKSYSTAFGSSSPLTAVALVE